MHISVVIPLFNGEDWIRETLRSVVGQTESPKEIIVVDDGSEDNSPDIVKEFPEVTLLENPGDGPYEARNYGARVSETETLAFVDQDDLWHEDHLQLMKRALEAYPGCVGVFSDIAYFSDTESPEYSPEGFSPHPFDPWELYPSNPLGEPVGAVVRRSAFEEVDRWNNEFVGSGGDFHLWLKLASLNGLVLTGGTTAAHRLHERSYSYRLRAEALEDSFSRRIATSEDALKRRQQRGRDIDDYVHRLEALKSLLGLLSAFRREDTAGMETSVKQFGTALSDESETGVAATWEIFAWYVTPYIEELDGREFEMRLLDLLGHLPEDASGPRKVLHEWATGRTPPALLVKRYPSKLYYWRLLVVHEIRKLRTHLTP